MISITLFPKDKKFSEKSPDYNLSASEKIGDQWQSHHVGVAWYREKNASLSLSLRNEPVELEGGKVLPSAYIDVESVAGVRLYNVTLFPVKSKHSQNSPDYEAVASHQVDGTWYNYNIGGAWLDQDTGRIKLSLRTESRNSQDGKKQYASELIVEGAEPPPEVHPSDNIPVIEPDDEFVSPEQMKKAIDDLDADDVKIEDVPF